jgi:arabinoxylan arabinofuranohydrolase
MIMVVAIAQNPISPPGFYIADPTGCVWQDGKLYIYGSADESCAYYCSHRYHVLFTEDLINWHLAENSFASKGAGDGVSYNDNLLFAPTAAYSNGNYFLYYCQPDREFAQDVAVASTPTGPFLNGRPMNVGDYNQNDPGVFIDDDGTAWYFRVQFALKTARLYPDMQSLNTSSIRNTCRCNKLHNATQGKCFRCCDSPKDSDTSRNRLTRLIRPSF